MMVWGLYIYVLELDVMYCFSELVILWSALALVVNSLNFSVSFNVVVRFNSRLYLQTRFQLDAL